MISRTKTILMLSCVTKASIRDDVKAGSWSHMICVGGPK